MHILYFVFCVAGNARDTVSVRNSSAGKSTCQDETLRIDCSSSPALSQSSVAAVSVLLCHMSVLSYIVIYYLYTLFIGCILSTQPTK